MAGRWSSPRVGPVALAARTSGCRHARRAGTSRRVAGRHDPTFHDSSVRGMWHRGDMPSATDGSMPRGIDYEDTPSLCKCYRRDRPGDQSMPVTAKLSRKLYETFGDEITNELVD